MVILILLPSLLLVYLLLSAAAAYFSLKTVVLAKRYSFKEYREKDSAEGFAEAIRAYDEEWNRQEFSLDCGDAEISGEFIRNPSDRAGPRKVAILCHGHTVNRIPSLKYARMFYDHGFDLVIYDERYFGQSTGRYCTLGYKETFDLAKIIRYARNLFGDDCIMALHGESMGAATALSVLAYETPSFVVADCSFANTLQLMHYLVGKVAHMPAFPTLLFVQMMAPRFYDYELTKVNPIDAVKESEVPICFMHGKADDFIPSEHSRLMFDVCRNPASELHLWADAGHARSVYLHPKEYEQALLAFIEKLGY